MTYIDFSTWYWEIPIGWIAIFDELEKFPGILFQPCYLREKASNKINVIIMGYFIATKRIYKNEQIVHNSSLGIIWIQPLQSDSIELAY